MPNDRFIASWVARLRTEIPETVAILLKGSHARDEAGPHSDVDFDALVAGEPYEDYLAWFDDIGDGRLRHVSVAVQDLDGWLSEASEPVSWSYGLPAAETTRLMWARDSMLQQTLDHPVRNHPPEEPELEDFIEAWGKARNAFRQEDDLALRLASQKLAQLCPTLLRPINPDVQPSNRREAMRDVLAFPVCPDGYRDDILHCFGLASESVSPPDLVEAARRLTFGTVALVRTHAEVFEPILPNDLYQALVTGVIDRYIRQE